MSIRVTVYDTETGDTSSAEIENDYILIVAGTCHLANSQTYPTKGTDVLTIKGRGSPDTPHTAKEPLS